MAASIRTQTLGALLGVGSAATLAVGGVLTFTLAKELKLQAQSTSQNRAEQISHHLQRRIQAGAKTLEVFAQTLKSTPMTEKALSEELSSVVRFHPLFRSIYVYSAEGRVLLRQYADGTADPEGRSLTLNTNLNQDFAEAVRLTLASGETNVRPVRGSRWGTLFVPCVVAIPGTSAPRGVLSAAISFTGEGLPEMIQGLSPGKLGYIALIDDTGQILAKTSHAPPELEDYLKKQPSLLGYFDLNSGRRDLVNQARVGEIGLRVLVGIPELEAYPGLSRALWLATTTMLVVLLFAALAAVWWTSKIVGPLGAFLEGIRQVEAGVFGHRIQVEGEDELAEVGRAFNRLAEALARNRLIEETWSDLQEPTPKDSSSSAEKAAPKEEGQ